MKTWKLALVATLPLLQFACGTQKDNSRNGKQAATDGSAQVEEKSTAKVEESTAPTMEAQVADEEAARTPYATYTELAIQVPKPPGISGLPSNVFFDINNTFTAAQKQRIKDAISGTMLAWATHQSQKFAGGSNTGVSALASCSRTFATKNLKPVWFRGTVSNGQQATNVAMDQFTQLIKDNGNRRVAKAKIDPRMTGTIVAASASTQTGVVLSLSVNPKQLDDVRINSGALTGSMFHAWLHRAGFMDPKATSFYIAEAPMCMMRGNQGKSAALPDSALLFFLD